MTIETERLIVYSISNDEIRELIEGEKDEELKKAYGEMLQGCLNEPENRLWYTVWHIALKNEPETAVGDLCFKGLSEDGIVEIGPEDFDANGVLIVDVAEMANDTFKSVGWCSAFLIGWFLERRFVGFTTEVPLINRITRMVIGLLVFYAVSLIAVPLIKEWIPGWGGTMISCFLQLFYVSFLFLWCIKKFEKPVSENKLSD